MILALSFRKFFRKNVGLLALTLSAFPALMQAQNNPTLKHLQPINYQASAGSLKTAATATCPTGPVALAASFSVTQNPIANGHVFECDKAPFLIDAQATTSPVTPCIGTLYTNYHNNIGTNGSETFYEGGTNIGCVGPVAGGCTFPIGGGTTFGGQPWGVNLYFIDSTQQHDFVFCRQGNITTTSISLIDCWNGNPILSVPPTPINFSNLNPPNTSTCFTLTVPANTDIGGATYTISPATAVGFVDFHTGEALVDPTLLSPGSYTVTYSFHPSSSSTCGNITGTFNFSIVPNVTVAVNSPTVCPGATATLTANAGGGTAPYTYSWTPSAGLSATTGSMVTVNNPTITTNYTVTATDANGCTSVDTAIVTVRTFTVNKATICSGNSATLIASDSSFSYSWSPAGSLNTTTNDTVVATPPTTTVYTVTGTNVACPSLTLTVTDSVIVKLSPTIAVLSPTVCSGTTATITAVGATSYTWSPLTNLTSSVTNDTVYIANPTTNLTYTAYGVGANGCKDSAVSTVVASNHLGILSGTPIKQCFGTPFGLSAIGASTYTWTSNDPANLNFGLDTSWHVQMSVANTGTASPTTYTVAIYGESHSGTFCQGYDTVIVTINPTPTVTVAPTTPICAGGTATLTASSTSTVTVNNYSWSPATFPANGATVNASPATTTVYTVTGTSTLGCAATATATQVVNPLPTFTINNIKPVFCLGDSSVLTISPTTTISATYIWTAVGLGATTANSITVSPTSTLTIYTVNATSSAGCHAASQATVTVNFPPNMTAPSNTTICSNGSGATLITTGGLSGYTWTPSASLSGATTATVVANPTVTTTYTVIGQINNCVSDPAFVTVTVTNLTLTANATNTLVCKGQSINLTASSNATSSSYTWSASNGGYNSNSQNPIISNATSTNSAVYTVTVSIGGCQKTDNVTVIVDSPTITVSPTTPICLFTTTNLTASGTGITSYTWSPATGLNTTSGSVVTAGPSATTIYSVIGSDGTCSTPVVIAIVSVDSTLANFTPNPQTGDAPLNVSFTNQSLYANNYTWDFGNGSHFATSNLSDTAKTVYPTVGTYTAVLTVTNTTTGCINSKPVVITVTEHYVMIIPNVFTPNGDGINDNFMVKSEGVSTFSMDIFDRWGLKMFSSTSVNSAWDGKTIGGKEVPDDTYFYVIKATSSKTNETQEYKGFITLIK
ncbi:MAG TPA: gliding motility-associated C-terminal domain-containing protein [Bacteroidia bacterium]|jgi:gliding motility-associated-like protein|nr:gliding motility-associated C-terminal domain-containing protein [Bacteroidia bacterium]